MNSLFSTLQQPLRTIAVGILALALMIGCGGQKFAFKDVEKDLETKITRMQEWQRAQPDLEKKLATLEEQVPKDNQPSPQALSAEPVEDYESRFGIGYPWMTNDQHYSPTEKGRLENLQRQVEALGPKLEPVFKLEAKIKVWERAVEPKAKSTKS